jgi:hypothetical protein
MFIGTASGIRIILATTTLSDGSKVFDLDLSQDGESPIRLSCVSDKDAYALVEVLKAAIHTHTVDLVTVHEVVAS